jgi:hypothetical protein
MLFAIRLAVCAVVAWQAVVATANGVARLTGNSGVDWQLRLTADTDARVRWALGDDAETMLALREIVPRYGVVGLWQGPSWDELSSSLRTPEDLQNALDRYGPRHGLFIQLSGLLFPDVGLLASRDAIHMVETEAGIEWLLALPGDPEPAGRPDWTLVRDRDRFRIWRCRKD